MEIRFCLVLFARVTDLANFLVLKVQLELLPEEEEEDSGRDFPYWYVGVPVFAIGGVLFLIAYKWAAASQVRALPSLDRWSVVV